MRGGDAAQERQGLLHAIVHVDEGRRVEDGDEGSEPLVDLVGARDVAGLDGGEELGRAVEFRRVRPPARRRCPDGARPQFADFARSLGLTIEKPQSRFELQRVLAESAGRPEARSALRFFS